MLVPQAKPSCWVFLHVTINDLSFSTIVAACVVRSKLLGADSRYAVSLLTAVVFGSIAVRR
jgi:hypothetical protein